MTGSGSPRLSIDGELCQGHGRCYALAPQLFDCDEAGHGVVTASAVPAAELDEAENAADSCPEQAITFSS